MKRKAKLTADQKDIARRVAKNAARIKAEWNAKAKADNGWVSRRAALEAELLLKSPHLAEQKHCGLVVETPDDVPKRRVELPNGVVIFSSWYKVLTTLADSRKAHAEQTWLTAQRSQISVHA